MTYWKSIALNDLPRIFCLNPSVYLQINQSFKHQSSMIVNIIIICLIVKKLYLLNEGIVEVYV